MPTRPNRVCSLMSQVYMMGSFMLSLWWTKCRLLIRPRRLLNPFRLLIGGKVLPHGPEYLLVIAPRPLGIVATDRVFLGLHEQIETHLFGGEFALGFLGNNGYFFFFFFEFVVMGGLSECPRRGFAVDRVIHLKVMA